MSVLVGVLLAWAAVVVICLVVATVLGRTARQADDAHDLELGRLGAALEDAALPEPYPASAAARAR